MKLLALDTSTRLTGIALLDTETGQSHFARQEMTTHSEAIIPLIDSCLKKQRWNQGEIEGIACGAGPGSFTGLRIGFATAKGLCFALHIPLVLVSSLEALARQKKALAEEQPTLACVYASQGKVYARLVFPKQGISPVEDLFLLQLFLSQKSDLPKDQVIKLLQDHLWNKEELRIVLSSLQMPFFICGDGFLKFPELLVPQAESLVEFAPHPLDIALLGFTLFQKGELASIEEAVPFYLMPSAAEQKEHKG